MNNNQRDERLSLKETRDKKFDVFRRNLRVLRVSLDISAVELSKKLKLKNGKRCIDLEYGRGNPKIEELFSICKYFNVAIDDMMNTKAIISFSKTPNDDI